MSWVLCVLALGLAALSAADQCDNYGNGCSIPFNWNYFYKNLFTHACNRHDICYGCGAKFGVSRLDCDNKFSGDMYAACNTLSKKRETEKRQAINRVFCRAVVLDYYTAVRAGGSSHYKSASNPDSYCSQTWVRQCF